MTFSAPTCKWFGPGESSLRLARGQFGRVSFRHFNHSTESLDIEKVSVGAILSEETFALPGSVVATNLHSRMRSQDFLSDEIFYTRDRSARSHPPPSTDRR
jgi:hypothetical protein